MCPFLPERESVATESSVPVSVSSHISILLTDDDLIIVRF